jgi:integrase
MRKRLPANRDGHHIWTGDEVAAYRAAHPLGSLARLVFELAIGTGWRREDLTKVGRQHVSSGKIRFVPQKTQRRTGKMAVAVITPDLQAALDLVPRGDRLTFILGPGGREVTPDHLGDLFREWCREAQLPARCTLHELRKHLGSTIASRGGGQYEVGAVLAIDDPKTIAVYTRAALPMRSPNAPSHVSETPTIRILTNQIRGLSKWEVYMIEIIRQKNALRLSRRKPGPILPPLVLPEIGPRLPPGEAFMPAGVASSVVSF